MQKFREDAEDPEDQIGLQPPRARNRLGSWAPAAVALNSDLCIILVRILGGKTGAYALLSLASPRRLHQPCLRFLGQSGRSGQRLAV